MYHRASELKRFLPEGESAETENIVLVHGLFLSGHIFYPIGKELARNGYRAIIYDYPTRKYGIAEHGKQFSEFLTMIMRKTPGKKFHIVTHSLGGIITRAALPHIPPEEHVKLGRIIQIVPPNHGSDIAREVTRFLPWFGCFSKVLPELSSHPSSIIHTIPFITNVEFGVIAARHDLEVREQYTHLGGEQDHVLVSATHTGILFRKETATLIRKFLQDGTFSKK